MKKYTKQEKINLITVIIAIIITSIAMVFFINQKEGWHEDEIFSYGSSNYKYDNLFQRYAEKDSINQLIDEKIMNPNPITTIKNMTHYLTHQDEFWKEFDKKRAEEHPIWKTSQEAKEYLTVSNDEILSYWSVYYNQSRDVHPPLFYMLVHLVSSFSLNHFSKYIIFVINLAFYIGSCFVIRKIMKQFNKDNLSGIAILLYGLSMGAISIVMFQRMYMVLTFFVLAYLYLTIKISKNNFEIDKKTKRLLICTTISGFLTQYYFCIYAVFLAIVAIGLMIKRKQYANLKQYIICHLKAAIIGVIIFPASIYHIFFSYRGVAGGVVDVSYLDRLIENIKLIFYSFSIPKELGYGVILILAIWFVTKLIKSKKRDSILLLSIPVILFILTITKIAPFINIRYISPILPIIVIVMVLLIQNIITYLLKLYKDRKNINLEKRNIYLFTYKYLGLIVIATITIGISSYGLIKNKPQFLFTGYEKRIKIAEQYKKLKHVYVGESEFCHLQDIEEFLRYDQSLIINTYQLDILKDEKGLQEEKQYILNIKCWISNLDDALNKVFEYTNASEYELLLDDGQSRIYKVTI